MPVHKPIGNALPSAMNNIQAPARTLASANVAFMPQAAFGLSIGPVQRFSALRQRPPEVLAESADPSHKPDRALPPILRPQSCKSARAFCQRVPGLMFDLLRCTHFQNRARVRCNRLANCRFRKTHCGQPFSS